MAFFAADAAEVFARFGIEPARDRSYHPWSPVFPAWWRGRRVVLKHAAPRAAGAVAAWCRHLVSLGVRVVAPVGLPVPNPAMIGDRWWVVYPWIEGRPYAATRADLAAAGDLLGRVHAAGPPDAPPGEPPGERLPEFSWVTWLEEEPGGTAAGLDRLRDRLARHAPADAARLYARLGPLGRDFARATRPAVRDAGLPSAAVCMDFKAGNLVFAPDGPVLVDPDGAVRAPRVLDLALAALLFHTELAGTPGRLFTPAEWRAFRDAYLARVTPTGAERRAWPDALDYVLWDEGTWAILDSTEWHVERQRSYLLDLAGTARGAYAL